MLWTITINLVAWKLNFPDAKLHHAVIFEIIKNICDSKSKKMIRTPNGFTLVNSNLILTNCPLLNFKTKAALTTYIKQLNEWGLIQVQKDGSNNRYYKITEKAEFLMKTSEDDAKSLEIILKKARLIDAATLKVLTPKSGENGKAKISDPFENIPEDIRKLTEYHIEKYQLYASDLYNEVTRDGEKENQKWREWALDFDRLFRIDLEKAENGLHRICLVIHFLYTDQEMVDFWIKGKRFCNAGKFRERLKNNKDITYFSFFEAEYNNRKTKKAKSNFQSRLKEFQAHAEQM